MKKSITHFGGTRRHHLNKATDKSETIVDAISIGFLGAYDGSLLTLFICQMG
jgi:hypothetical protein